MARDSRNLTISLFPEEVEVLDKYLEDHASTVSQVFRMWACSNVPGYLEAYRLNRHRMRKAKRHA